LKGIPQGRYTKEFRQEAVKLVTEEGLSWAEAARRLSLPTSTLANWVKAYNAGKLSSRVLCEGVAARYASMKELRLDYPLALVRRVLSVSASGYYSWLDRPLSKWAREETRLEVEIKAAHKRTRQVCGAEKLQHDLADHGIQVGVCRIKRIRQKLGIRCKQKRKFKATTDSKHKLPVADNIPTRISFPAISSATRWESG